MAALHMDAKSKRTHQQAISTIIIPEFFHPNFLSLCLRKLVQYSRLKHKILVVGSDLDKVRQAGAEGVDDLKDTGQGGDWLIDPRTEKKYRKYYSMNDFLRENREWMEDNGIEYVDVTEEAIEFRKKYKRGEVVRGKTELQGGVDIAFKNNFGLRLVDTEFVIPNFDDDMIPSPGWDEPLFNLAEKYSDTFSVFIPTHVQPYLFSEDPGWSDCWTESRQIACNRLAIPIVGRNDVFLYEEEWTGWCERNKRHDILSEPCGVRAKLHYLPMLYRTECLKMIGQYCYKGSGYELEIDDRAAAIGFRKISPCDSFILHKGYLAVRPEEV